MQKGTISVNTENIFPIIKKFLYSDHEIFLRELISNAVDATQKLKTLSSLGEFKGELGELNIEVIPDEKAGTLTIRDRGIGMTAEEIEKYINQIAFSGAEEFVNKYKDKTDANIIGHFGLGFYSAFMVADKVEIITKSYKKDTEGAHWVCDGSTEFSISKHDRTERGTDIILHINDENKEFLQLYKVQDLLRKYCRFLPVPIICGTRDEWHEDPAGEQDTDGKPKQVKTSVPNVINDVEPIWVKKPSALTEDDYRNFYSSLYPMTEPPLFWIHLNVDYPFNLTGILYFPEVKADIDPNRNKIQLYSNQVFVTDSVKDIVPDFLMLLHGVIDSPDIPLNVSRSSLQSDSNVKKITSHITKKVSDKLEELFNSDRKDFERKWENMNLFVKYGIVSEEKFADRAKNYVLLKNTAGEYFTIEEYKTRISGNQTDKDNKLVLLYSSDVEQQHSFIEAASNRSYDVLQMDGLVDNHFISWLESQNENMKLVRVDSDSMDKLIDKGEKKESVLSETAVTELKELFNKHINNPNWTVEAEPAAPADPFIAITRPEFDRRMKEMQKMGGGQFNFFGSMPDRYKLVLNSNHDLARELTKEETPAEKKEAIVSQAYDLALLSQNMLTGKQLSEFINRSISMLAKA